MKADDKKRNKKWFWLTLLGLLLGGIIVGLWYYGERTRRKEQSQIYAEVKRGKFEILVTVTGELQAERSVKIMAPAALRSRNLRFSQIKIQDLVPEGTVVDSGDYVAMLDRSAADNSLKDMLDELEQLQAHYEKTRLDTTMLLRGLRDQLINLQYAMEEAKITLEQSKYEPPATIRQAQINLDKSRRAYQQAKENYVLKVKQAEADMAEAQFKLRKQQRKIAEMEDVIKHFEIHAPAAGMVIYQKEWGGQKRKVGSTISPWDLVVATLPDMSSMLSKTYVNEIDISKVKKGQKVRIGVDAFPEKKYTGVVVDVANVGEQLPNTDAKVFEVNIKLDGSDPILRPAMTTSNQIITASYDSVLYIPLEAVFVEDSIPYVYTRKGYKQVVLLGPENENEVIVEKGLEEGEKILLTMPEDPSRYELRGEELIPLIRERYRRKRLEEERQKREEALKAERRKKRRGMRPGMRPGMKRPAAGGQMNIRKKGQ